MTNEMIAEIEADLDKVWPILTCLIDRCEKLHKRVQEHKKVLAGPKPLGRQLDLFSEVVVLDEWRKQRG